MTSPVAEPPAPRRSLYLRGPKRAVDLALVLLGAPVWLPLAAVVALAVRVGMGRPVLFAQERPGRSGRGFRMLKFRTMTQARDASGVLLDDESRLTPFGRALRRSSLDELPALFNVLSGKMSLVGPRPLLTRYLERYDARQGRRHEVAPGITGWAQINGRNDLGWEHKLELDVWYVEHVSLRLDLWILLRTLAVVLRGGGVSAAGHSTMPEFMGSKRDDA